MSHVTRTPGQKVKGQLDDVLNSKHAVTGATWRINTKTLLRRNSTATWRKKRRCCQLAAGGGILCVCMCVCINCVYLFIVFFFECVGVLPFDGEIKMYIYCVATCTACLDLASHA